jgi:hypothetical protein
VVESEVTRNRANFADTMGDLLEDISSDEEDEVQKDPLSIPEDARAELMKTMKSGNDDLTFGGSFNAGDAPSRKSNFSSSTGNTSHNKHTGARLAAETILNKELMSKVETIEKTREKERMEMEKERARLEKIRLSEMEEWKKEQEKQKQAFAAEREAWMLEKRAMETMVATQIRHGSPPVSGGAAAGVTPSTQDLEPDGSAAAQG